MTRKTTTSAGPSFDVSEEDAALINKLIDRAIKAGWIVKAERLDRQMDLTACHANGCPLDLQRMVDWERGFDIAHDIAGIKAHLNRDTGNLTGLFVPRFSAARAQAAAL